MPIDLSHFLRNSIPIDRYDAVRNGPAAQETAAAEAITGTLMGSTVEVLNDPLAELMDSLEELSFQFEENESKSVSERRLGSERTIGNRYLKALENWMQTLPDMPGDQFTRQLLSLLRQAKQSGQLPSANRFLSYLADGSADPSHQYAIIDVLEQALGEEDTAFRELLGEARKTLLATKGEEIRAGINLAAEVNARATTPQEMQELRDLYRGEILGFSTPQECFRSIMSSRGAAGLQAAIDFLTAGAGADLQSASPSKSPEELRRIILDLQCVQVLKTVLDRMSGLQNRMLAAFGENCLKNGEQLTGKIMDFTEMPYVAAEDIGEFIGNCGISQLLARMDFCRELTAVFRQLSSRLFATEKDRLHLIDVAQEHLDGIVEEEYEQQDERQDGDREDAP